MFHQIFQRKEDKEFFELPTCILVLFLFRVLTKAIRFCFSSF